MIRYAEKSNSSEGLARSITRSYSKQAYLTACLMVDKRLVDDCHRAYAYFRWVDNFIDDDAQPANKRRAFIKRQMKLMGLLYKGETLVDVSPEEKILVDLIKHDNKKNGYLQSYIRNFFAVLEFDANRKGRLVNEQELSWYSHSVGKAVTDVIFYFIGSGYCYPASKNRYLAAEASHITHMLRDYMEDVHSGYINIPKEYLNAHEIEPQDVNSTSLRNWVKQRVELARKYFRKGKEYIDHLAILRCKIVAYLYCARFESVLDTIERDNYNLRSEYSHRRSPFMWGRMGLLALKVALKHIVNHKVKESG